MTITNLAAAAAAGLIGDGTALTGNLNFGYATAGGNAVLNLTDGTKNTSAITLTSAFIGANLNFTGGAGSDVITVLGGSGATLTATINGSSGAGNDTVVFVTPADLTAPIGARVTNFETVAVQNNAGGFANYTPSQVVGSTTAQVLASNQSVQISGLA